MGNGSISTKQQEILDYIKSYNLTRNYPPTIREICKAVNLQSPSTVHVHLKKLEENGYIRRDPSKNRAIEIADDSIADFRTELISVPVVGRVAAGEPVTAEQNVDEYFPIPSVYLPKTGNTVFGLKVKGESMINAGIYDRDILIVESVNTAKNGDIVVALVDDSATVKTFYKENDHYRLQPENDAMEPIIVNNVEILGKVRSLFRPAVF